MTFDGSSGGGTVTVSHASNSITSLTMGAFTGTLDFATNDNNITLQTMDFSGSGTRTLNMGDGVWTITGTTGAIFVYTSVTNLTFNANASRILVAATPTGVRNINGNTTPVLNILEIDDTGAVAKCAIVMTGVKCATFTPTDARLVEIASGSSFTVNNGFTWTGTLARPPMLSCTSLTTGTGTFSVGGTVTGSLLIVGNIIKSGAGSITFTDSFDMGNNTGVTITAPAGTSAGGGLIRNPGMAGGLT